jgi:sec-independent protein translocase protein TatB
VFDVGFSELLLIALLALLLLGPERLPEVARAAGRGMAKLRNFVSNVKQDFDREMRGTELDELRRLKQELDETRRVFEESSGKVLSGITADISANATPAAPDTLPAPPPAVAPSPPPAPEARRRAAPRGRSPGAAKARDDRKQPKKKHVRRAKARKPQS